MKIHEKYIKRCLELAKNGLGTTRPNPIVGCVIVCDDVIIGEGYTSPFGGNHAEVNAIQSVNDKSLLKNATLYVSLEPCNHYGKTPPCSDLIVKSKIPKVVVGCIDPFEAVAGKGIEKLEKSGCEVVVGVLEEKCVAVNQRFFTFHARKRPYIVLKWAETIDGFMGLEKIYSDEKLKQVQLGVSNANPVWITNQYSRQLVHKMRMEEQAILVGTNTVISDNPKLDVRDWQGENPIRLVLDKNLRIPTNFNVLDGSIKTIVFTEKNKENAENMEYVRIDFSSSIAQQICAVLFALEIQSVFIEGGSQTLQTFVDANLWDEARIFTGNTTFTKGLKAPILIGEEISKQFVLSDTLRILKNSHC